MNPMKTSTRRFIRHYIEMVVVMALGMFALGAPADAVVHTSGRPAPMLAEMAVTMTLPMVAWMRFRGHAWRPCNEMAASMLLPAAGAIGLLEAGLVTHTGMLMVVEHAAMLASMLIAMLLRRNEYTGHHHHHHEPVAT
jgi:hypothetical protein